MDTTPEVRVEVPPEVSAALDELAEVSDNSRRVLLEDVMDPQPEYVEQGEGAE
jgi:predicted transcriptional regulator